MKNTIFIEEMLAEHRQLNKPITTAKLNFIGGDGLDVYNISKPFLYKNDILLAGRVEKRDSEHAHVHIFKQVDNTWVSQTNMPILELQDPFITTVRGELILGGVEIFPHPDNAEKLSWRTVFYKGKSIQALELFYTGPNGMKDIRFVDLGKTIGVFTRPQGAFGGRGKIGFCQISDWSELNNKLIASAPLITGIFSDEEWGGVNDAIPMNNTSIALLAHIASFDAAGNRHYYPMTCIFDYESKQIRNQQIIFERKQLPTGASKRSDLVDVIFPGGMKLEQEQVTIYCGVSDAEAYAVTIDNPFSKEDVYSWKIDAHE